MRIGIPPLLLLARAAAAAYTQYPDNLGPSAAHLGAMYGFATPLNTLDNHLAPATAIMHEYRFSDSNRGFIVNKNNRVGIVLYKKNFTGNAVDSLGKLTKLDAESTFWEQRPTRDDNTVFVDNYLGFEEVGTIDLASGDKRCLVDMPGATPAEMEDLCVKIPRCLGYVLERCLLDSAYEAVPSDVGAGKPLYLKKLRHAIFVKLGEHGPLVVFGALVGVAAQQLDLILHYLRRLARGFRGKKSIRVLGTAI